MQFHHSQSEEIAIKAMIEAELNGHEETLLKLFIQGGPEQLRAALKVPNNFIWSVVFDHLVFNLDALKRCIEMFFPFFKDYVVKNGPLALRELFGIEDARYNPVFEKLLDDMVIARGLIFDHIHENIVAYLDVINNHPDKTQQKIDLRIKLGIAHKKYDPLWTEIMDFLLDAYCRNRLKIEQKKKTKVVLRFLQSLF